VFVEPDPFVLVEEGFTGEGPTLNIEQLLLVAIALEHDVALFADPLNFTEGGLKFENTEVVERGKGDNEIEGFVLEGVWILSAMDKEVRLELGVHTSEPVFGDVKSDNLELRLEELHFVKEKSFSTTDIENA
jgi:hypothetical protein